MKVVPIPKTEPQRLEKLYEYGILDTPDEQDYGDIARPAAEICGTSMSTISFVDRGRQWFKAGVGLTRKETSRYVAFSAHTIRGDDLCEVFDAARSALESRLLSIVSHDLRSPLAGIASTVSLPTDHDISREEERALFCDLQHLFRSTEYLIDNVISWASRQLNHEGFEIVAFPVSPFVTELEASLRYDTSRKENLLTVHRPSDLCLRTDRDVPAFILRNLPANVSSSPEADRSAFTVLLSQPVFDSRCTTPGSV